MSEVNEAGDRVHYAAKLYKEGKAPLIVVSGGFIDFYGSIVPESEAMKELLMNLGVPHDAIIEESRSRNTHENALYLREIADKEEFNQILLVTSGLGRVFPYGLPVGRVTKVERDPAEPLASIQAEPIAKIDAEREVLFIWARAGHPAAPASDAAIVIETPKPAPKPKPATRPAPKPAAPAVTPAPTPAPDTIPPAETTPPAETPEPAT